MTRFPRLIFNTDGNWMLFYLPDRNPDGVTHQLEALVPAGVDALAGLIGIDDDVVWRGSPHSAMWGDDTEVWDPDPDVDAEGNPIRKMTAGRPVLVLRHHHGSRGHSGRDLLRDVGNPLLRVVVDPATLRFNGLTRDELIDLLVDALVAATKELTGSEPSAEEIAEMRRHMEDDIRDRRGAGVPVRGRRGYPDPHRRGRDPSPCGNADRPAPPSSGPPGAL